MKQNYVHKTEAGYKKYCDRHERWVHEDTLEDECTYTVLEEGVYSDSGEPNGYYRIEYFTVPAFGDIQVPVDTVFYSRYKK